MIMNVLIISDNVYICRKFYEIIQNKRIENCLFFFSISPFSNKELFAISEGIEVLTYDFKNQEDVDYIKRNYNLIFSAHCKQIFPNDLVNSVKCVNVHPGYNPINRGWYPQVFSLINKLPIGATIHEIDEQLDHGDIIARAFVEKTSFDTSESLYNKIIAKELELFDQNIESIICNNYKVTKPEFEGDLFLKKDFNNLLEIDLEEKVSVGDFIDRMRALTHGDFDNAYFIDPISGKKVFIGITLKLENNG